MAIEDDGFASGARTIGEALEKMRLRLLELTRRNRLLNFKATAGKSLRFCDAHPEAVFKRLMEPTERRIALNPVPEPTKDRWVMRQGRLTRPEAAEHARTVGIDTSFELHPAKGGERPISALRALEYPEELAGRARRLASSARTAIEETGANMLFLLLGFLEFPESAGSDKLMVAPLVLVPTSLEKGEPERGSAAPRYSLLYTGEELEENLSLREKLKADFELELPERDEEVSLEDYFRLIEDAVKGLPGFVVRRQATLALVSMSRMLLVRDLNPMNWPNSGPTALLQHPIVRRVLTGGGESGGGGDEGEDHSVEDHPLAALPLIYDADSSQHSALIDARLGKNLVIEGPPGTGKSQTITNLIASAIVEGKKILFIAEKLAALQVVRDRLAQAGLGDFCLELHSNKTTKKALLDQVAKRRSGHYFAPRGLVEELKALEEKRKALSTYAALVNSVLGNAQGLTVHEVLWRAERYRRDAGEAWMAAQKLVVARAEATTGAEFDSLKGELSRLVREHARIVHFDSRAPFWGFYPRSLAPGEEISIRELIERAIPACEALSTAYEGAARVAGEEAVGLAKEEATRIVEQLAGLERHTTVGMAEDCLPRMFTSADRSAEVAREHLARIGRAQRQSVELRAIFEGRLFAPESLTPEALADAKDALDVLSHLGIPECSPRDLSELATRLRDAAANVHRAVAELDALGKLSGIPVEHTERCLKRIQTVLDLATRAPHPHLHRRCHQLAAPDAGSIIEEAMTRFRRIAGRHTALESKFYLSVGVDESRLEEAIVTLQEGDEWWRVLLSGRYRRAIALHRGIARNKKASRSQRREELEMLLLHLREVRSAKSEPRYSRVMGSHFEGEESPFESLLAVASWLREAEERLLAAELSSEVFPALEIAPARLAALAGAASRYRGARSELEALQALVESRFAPASSFRQAFTRQPNWAARADLVMRVSQKLQTLAQEFQRWATPETKVSQIAAMMAACEEHKALALALDGDTAARALLGARFAGLESDIRPALDALSYGQAVRSLALPARFETLLLSEEGARVRERLLEVLARIESAWHPVEIFCDSLGVHGAFELAQWAGVAPSSADFAKGFAERARAAAAATDELLAWVQYLQAADRARERGLEAFVSLLETEKIPRDVLVPVFGYRFYGSIAEALFASEPALGRFSGYSHENLRHEFAELDRSIIKLRGRECAATSAAAAKPPGGVTGAKVGDKTEMELIKYLLPQIRPKVSIRHLMRASGRAVQEYLPCFMMSPQAVAQFLEPGKVAFDIVVMDEASQLKTEEAIGSVARGKQLIVVGDPKQLPPTAFFDKLGETQEDMEEGERQAALTLESILDLCMGHFPLRRLKWHYRSQHQSLIAFSNTRFYGGDLIVFPSPYERSRALGVEMRYVRGAVYENQQNAAEASVVVDAILAHMKARPQDSLGVVTLNLKQRDLIEQHLEKRMEGVAFADAYRERWGETTQGFFVKNLENVQGDERDVIFVSTTFGPARDSNAVYQRFGPISRDDGWRRLNVVFTRARKALTVFTSMRPEDIVEHSGTPRGTVELKAYLEFARSGVVPQNSGSQGPPESDFEVAVMGVLESAGYSCVPQLGVAGFRLDLAVKHPRYVGGYLAAIECDGASYHSGRSARDRDRIRQDILESLGWRGRIFRIWSTDWFRNPAGETRRLLEWLKGREAEPLDAAYLPPEPEEVASGGVVASKTFERDVPLAEIVVTPSVTTLAQLGVSAEDDEDEPLEVQIGDRVTYQEGIGGAVKTVIVGRRNDLAKGEISDASPLAEAMLGLQEGDLGSLEQPGRPVVVLKIVKVERSTAAALV